MEYDKFIEKYLDINDDTGLNEVILMRQAKLKGLRVRLKKYFLSDEEIDKLFEIIVNAELEMEKIKQKFNSKKYSEDDLNKFQDKLISIQNKMKEDFDNKLNKKLKEKYENAKKILEKRKKQN